jgi:dipeptidyl aminopeptidase/acylaminoacyl peptidase
LRHALLVALPLLAGSAPALAVPLHDYADLALSPDGTRLATVEKSAEPAALSKAHGAILVRASADGRVLAKIDPCKTCGYGDLAYGPAGELAYVQRDRDAGTASLMVVAGTAKPRKLATVKGLAAEPRWSPDGKSIALLVTEGATKETGAAQAGAREVGEIGERYDEKRIAIVPVAGGPLRMVSPADRFVYEYNWTPDGRGFVATSAPGNGDANWWVATVDAIDAASGTVRTIVRPTTQVNYPRISPDGKTVAFIGGLMSDFGSVGGDVWTVPFAGGPATNVTPGYKGSFTSLGWDAGGLRGVALLGDQAAAVPIDPVKGPAEPVWTAAVSTAAADGNIAFSRDGGRMAMVAQDYEHAAAIFAGPIGHPVQISTENAAVPGVATARSIHWKSDNFDVQGWLLSPRAAPVTGKVPMIVEVHGGPAAANRPHFVGGQDAELLKAGYWIFLPNPRGSFGQGEAFTQANRRDFGGGDLKDILAGIDAVEKVAPVDDSRLGLMGGSYGGFMSMWANTQTNRFKAIWAAAGLSDWISYYGTNGINQWMIPYFGKSMYEDQKAYWDVSAIQFITRAKTPTLITVGERDIEVPPTQSVEYWNGLKAAGVPASLIIYPDEGHGIRQPDHQADMRRRVLAWFNRYLGGQ